MNLPTLRDIVSAAERVSAQVQRTPVLTSAVLDAQTRSQLFFKCEVFQRTGSFKFRGASSAVLSLGPEALQRGVATHSSGNHGAALALAARLRNLPAYVVMPRTAPRVKRRAVEYYGARIIECEPTLAAREAALQAVVRDTQAEVVHPFNDARVIAGQGTAALELLQQASELDAVVVPVGGGGLASGTALSVAGLAPRTRVIGVEPAAADDAQRSLRTGVLQPSTDPVTVADGLRTALGDLTFAILKRHLAEVVTVTEEQIVAAMRLVWEHLKVVVEPSSAVPIAAVLGGQVAPGRIGIIVSGGNVDLDRLPWALPHSS